MNNLKLAKIEKCVIKNIKFINYFLFVKHTAIPYNHYGDIL